MSIHTSHISRRCLIAVATLSCLVGVTACGGTSGATNDTNAGDKSVTVYSADGLDDWYKGEFADFTKKTGIKVQYVEAGSGEVVSRVAKEKTNTQADLMVTPPPFIQQATAQGLLESNVVKTDGIPADQRDKDGHWVPLVNNYLTMIRNTKSASKPEKWDDLLTATYSHKIQYSTPGQTGDGTALLVLLEEIVGKKQAMDYFAKLQSNNVGSSSSTGKLGPKVSSGELLVANSDIQMAELAVKNDGVAYEPFFPADAQGTRSTVALPYTMGVVAGAPHKDNAVKLADFLTSTDVQQAVPEKAMGMPGRTDVKPTGEAATMLSTALKGVKIIHPDWDSIKDSLGDDLAAYKKVTDQ